MDVLGFEKRVCEEHTDRSLLRMGVVTQWTKLPLMMPAFHVGVLV